MLRQCPRQPLVTVDVDLQLKDTTFLTADNVSGLTIVK
jgi:hypothetical protein